MASAVPPRQRDEHELSTLGERADRLGHHLETLPVARRAAAGRSVTPKPAEPSAPSHGASHAARGALAAAPVEASVQPPIEAPVQAPVQALAPAPAPAQTPLRAPVQTAARVPIQASAQAPIQRQGSFKDRLARYAMIGGGLTLAGGLLASAPIAATVGGAALAGGGLYAGYRAFQQRQADRRSSQLDRQSRSLHEQFNTIKADGSAQERKRLLERMDAVQTQHTAHIDYLHKNDLDLWTSDPLNKKQRAKLNESWNELRHGTGLIKTPGEKGNEGINRDLRAHHARLLSRPHGRDLLYQLLDKDDDKPKTGTTVNILPRDPVTREQRRAARVARNRLGELEPEYEHLHGTLTQAAERHGTMFKDLPPQYSEDRARYRQLDNQIYDLRRNAKTPDVAEAGATYGGGGANSYRGGQPGAGWGSDVNLASNIHDSDLLNRDKGGNLIPAPAFVAYAHELIHTLHNKRGTERTSVNADDYQHRDDLQRWTSKEEHDTIASKDELSENWLRREHGIALRDSHFGIARDDSELA
jgi:hypothetical protein